VTGFGLVYTTSECKQAKVNLALHSFGIAKSSIIIGIIFLLFTYLFYVIHYWRMLILCIDFS